jgi:2-amino-4-hydroxy-6-hydroxymethyldihydropteridine diphosphokinase
MKAVIALGANIGNPKEQMDLAVAMLREVTDFKLVSNYYLTKPVSNIPQADYLNAVCIVESDLPALDLLALLQGIEKTLGRERNERWGPRTIDLDLIQYGSLLSSADELQLPHPHAHERRFVIEPWHAIEPDANLLTYGKISEILEQLP